MLNRRQFLSTAAALNAAPALFAQTAAVPLKRENDPRHLFLDARLIARSEGLQLVLGKVEKDPRNPLFGEDRPWEPRFDNLYANAMYDEDEKIYKAWYSPFIVDKKTSSTPRAQRPYARFWPTAAQDLEMGICYATSRDGLVWEKPELGLVEYNGSKRNNLVMRNQNGMGEPHGAGILKDVRETDPARRYKMFCNRPGKSMQIAYSADGLRWQDPISLPEIEAAGDTHNNLLWSPELRRWVGITRLWDPMKRQRVVGRTESQNLVKWTRAIEVLRALPSERWRQTYAMPVFRHANVYLGLVMLINIDGDNDTVDCELAWSADTVNWERIMPGTPFIPRGPIGSYDSMCLFAGAYPIHREGEIRLYYGGNNGKHTSYRDGFFCLAHLRPDGYAALAGAAGAPGVVETHPMECVGTQLRVTADAAGGEVRVGVVDAEGYGLAECEPIHGNVTDQPIRWRGSRDFSAFLGKHARLRFQARAARLYSFSFA